jgi:hypothetical protein
LELGSSAFFPVAKRINFSFVIEVAIIALGNNIDNAELRRRPDLLIGMTAILFGLSATYFVLKKSGRP